MASKRDTWNNRCNLHRGGGGGGEERFGKHLRMLTDFGRPFEFSRETWRTREAKSAGFGRQAGSAGKERVAWTSVRMAGIDPSEPSSGVAGTPPQG